MKEDRERGKEEGAGKETRGATAPATPAERPAEAFVPYYTPEDTAYPQIATYVGTERAREAEWLYGFYPEEAGEIGHHPWLWTAPAWCHAIRYWVENMGDDARDFDIFVIDALAQGWTVDDLPLLVDVEANPWAWAVWEPLVREEYRREWEAEQSAAWL